MANEYKLVGYDPSQAVSVQLLDDALIATGAAVPLTEVSPGNYLGSAPGGLPEGEYVVTFLVGGEIIATGVLNWDGTAEVPLGGLTVNNIAEQQVVGSSCTLRARSTLPQTRMRSCR